MSTHKVRMVERENGRKRARSPNTRGGRGGEQENIIYMVAQWYNNFEKVIASKRHVNVIVLITKHYLFQKCSKYSYYLLHSPYIVNVNIYAA